MTREFYQMHECAGYRAKVTIEWSSPQPSEFQDELDKDRMYRAEEIAGALLANTGPAMYRMVQAMRGRSA